MKYVLAIDQGTTSTRAILFDEEMQPAATSQMEFKQYFPKSGWVEHKPDDLLNTTLKTCNDVIANHNISATDIATIGITNQRETTLVWDKTTGKAIHNAIVWQDRRTAAFCAELRAEGFEAEITHRTGLLADPYFSGTKLRHILQTAGDPSNLLFGTVDSFLIWHLTEGRVHATDATNASRTMLYNIRNGAWDETICARFGIPLHMLPIVLDCAANFGTTTLFGGKIPIEGVAGDQQAATIGQACFEPGMMKSTYGTGCFALLNTGDALVKSKNRLLGTIAYQVNGTPTYALEGSIFVAGAVVQWLRDGLRILADAPVSQCMAEAADPEQFLYMVPAFTGLGAPYWDAQCRGAIFGLTRNTGPNEFAKAALESVGFQTRDLIEAMQADGAPRDGQNVLRVDGGMAASDWTMQFLSDILGVAVDRPTVLETTALGAAWLAGMKSGIYPSQSEFAKTWAAKTRFVPKMDAATRNVKYAGWKDAISRVLTTPQ